ncbi:DUF302 domain-containing protein [Candidatus Peribacteria bacterium]|nr:DUF302 domain-containing protein [Candidatus Peribacteria bacterium]
MLENQIEAGLLLPCHVTVFEKGGNVHVGFLSPKKILSLADNEKIDLVAEEAEKQLQVIFKNI